MQSSQFQALIKALKSESISKFISLVDQFTENEPSNLTNSKNYNQFRAKLEKAYYEAISDHLHLMRNNFAQSKEDLAKLFDYSDKLGIFVDVSNIDAEGIISELHIDGLRKGLRSRIIELVSFFSKYNLFERNFTTDELKIIQDIKDNDKLLAVNLKELFGAASDSLIFYVCKVMSYDYVKWIRSMLENPRGHNYLMGPNALKNWTDGYAIYDLVVRNLGRVEDFIKKVEDKQNEVGQQEDMIFLEFSPIDHYRITRDGLLRYSEIHIVYPEIIKQHKTSILNKDNYNFYSLSMVLIGGTGPEGLGFTYSTPKGEIIEICSDQKETEAIVIKFKQYLKRKFLDKLEKEMNSMHIDFDIRNRVIKYLSEIINPKAAVSYYNKSSMVTKIRNFLLQIEEFRLMDESKLKSIMEKISFAISMILRSIKLKDQFMARMDLVAKGKLKSEDISKLTSLRGKSHYDVLIERMFLQNKPKWFFKNYPKEILELEAGFEELRRELNARRRELNFDF
ncbi:MAG: hypothetical protein ACW98D_01000 [Promethearchaeota archaeon]|jgi:hypothetical protein